MVGQMAGVNASESNSAKAGRIRVLHVVTSLEPGGLENGVVNLTNRLDRRRFESGIVCLERLGAFCDRLAGDVWVRSLDKPPGFNVRAVRDLAAILRDWRPCIIHTHNLGPLTYAVLARVFSRSGAVIVQGEHAELTPEEKGMKRLWMRRLFFKACWSGHVVSAGLKDDLSAAGLPGDRFDVILNGVDCDRFSPVTPQERAAVRSEIGLPETVTVIGICGRFGEFKGHERLLDAFDRLASLNDKIWLLIVGDHGPRRSATLAKLDESPHRKKIVWVGYQADPVKYYRSMDLLVIPSVNEGLSNAMLEAMACGVPCLANTACGAREVIQDGDNGFLGSLESVDSLAVALDRLLTKPEQLPRAGQAARRTASGEFSLESMLAGYSRFYESAVSANTPG